MSEDTSFGRARRLFLFIMLVMCTLLHGLSIAPYYIPAIGKALTVMGVTAR